MNFIKRKKKLPPYKELVLLPPDFLEQRKGANKFKVWFIDTWYSIWSLPLLVRTFGLWWITYDDFVCREIGIGSHEREEIKFYHSYIKKDWVVFDVGAHAGLCTCIFSRLVGKNGKIIAFEPSLREIARLKRTLWINGCKNVMPLPLGLSDKQGTSKFYVSIDANTGRNTITPDGDAYSCCTEIPTTTMDLFASINQVERVDFLKIDVEGAEYLVFSGGINTINKFHPDILFEEWKVYGKLWKDCQEIPTIKFLNQLGYKFFTVLEGKIYCLQNNFKINTNNLFASVRS